MVFCKTCCVSMCRIMSVFRQPAASMAHRHKVGSYKASRHPTAWHTLVQSILEGLAYPGHSKHCKVYRNAEMPSSGEQGCRCK